MEHELDKVIEGRGTAQASRAFKMVNEIMNNPDGVDGLTAMSVANFWNQCVVWEMPAGTDCSGFFVEPVGIGDAWGIKPGPDVQKAIDGKIKRRRK